MPLGEKIVRMDGIIVKWLCKILNHLTLFYLSPRLFTITYIFLWILEAKIYGYFLKDVDIHQLIANIENIDKIQKSLFK